MLSKRAADLLWGCLLTLLLVSCTTPGLECTDPLGCLELRPDEPIVLATLLDNVSGIGALHDDVTAGITLALADRGERLLGHPVLVRTWEAECDATSGAAGASEIVDDLQVLGVIGTVCTESAAGAIPILAEQGLVMISPADTGTALTRAVAAGAPPAYFRTIYHDRLQGEVMARFAYENLGARTAGIVQSPIFYANDLADSFADVFTELGGVVQHTRTLAAAQTEISTLLNVLAAFPPDVLYLPLFEPEATNLVFEVDRIEALAEMDLLGPDGLLLESFVRSSGEAVDGMYLTGPYVAGAAYSALRLRWNTLVPPPSTMVYHAHAYDAVDLLLTTTAAVAQEAGDGSLLIGRQALRQALAATQDHRALTGVLTCTAAGECASPASLAVFQIMDPELPDGTWPPEVVWRPEEE